MNVIAPVFLLVTRKSSFSMPIIEIVLIFLHCALKKGFRNKNMAFAKRELKSSICLLLGLRWAFGGGILGGCASSLPVLRIHPQFCHSYALDQ